MASLEEKINQLVTDIAVIKERVTNITDGHMFPCNTNTEKLEDLEARVRRIETWQNKVIGAIVIANFISALLVAILLRNWK